MKASPWRGSAVALIVTAMAWLAGCSHPISAQKVPVRLAYRQATANALGGKTYSSETRLALHRFDFNERFKKKPAETLQWLHEKALIEEVRGILRKHLNSIER